MKRLLFAAAGLALAVAFASPASAAGFNITDVVRASPADLNAALADATAHQDAFAMQCYSGVIAYNAANPQVAPFSDVQGFVSGFQAARDTVKSINGGVENFVPRELISACGPLALDAQNDIGHASLMLFGLRLF